MENEKTLSQQIAEISTQLKLSDIDQRTIDNAKIFMLDCLGCILSGSQIINAKVIRKSAQDISGDGPCTIFGTGAKVNPMMAALVNGTTGHSQDYDDDHREGTQHASVAVLPAVLALAEKYGAYCHTVAHNILGDHPDAEECVNDAYLAVWNGVPSASITMACRPITVPTAITIFQ